MMSRRHWWCNLIGALLGSLALAPVMVLLLDRREPLETIGGRMQPFDVHPGDEVRLTWTVRERRSCDGRLDRVFIDSAGIVHQTVSEPTVYHRSFAGHRTFQKLVTIPKGMTAGPAIYTSRIERWCNPLQRWLWPIKSDGLQIPFNVIE